MASHRATISPHALSLQALASQLPASITLDGEEAEHLVVVRRAELGEPVELLDGQGSLAQGTISSLHRSKKSPTITLDLTSIHSLPVPACQITIWSAIPKGDRSATMIDMLAQLGALAWAPLHTARGVVEASDHKSARLQRVATEASKQSGRPWHLQIGSPQTLDACRSWHARNPQGQIVIADGQGQVHPPTLPASLTPKQALVLIGPEGGFTPDELAGAQSLGAFPLSLGEHILRIETAAIAATVKLLSLWQA
jgi:16S rRNA (uracil1498-N3)-methyltransferase